MINFNKKIKKNRGFTYVELIVVLSIFAIMTSLVIFNYGAFQAKVDVENYANDIALKIVQAQKDAMSGKQPTDLQQQPTVSPWKPSYGVFFDGHLGSTNFIYYVESDKSSYLYKINGYESMSAICPNGSDLVKRSDLC